MSEVNEASIGIYGESYTLHDACVWIRQAEVSGEYQWRRRHKGMGRSELPRLADPNAYDRYHNERDRKENGELEKSFLEASSCADG